MPRKEKLQQFVALFCIFFAPECCKFVRLRLLFKKIFIQKRGKIMQIFSISNGSIRKRNTSYIGQITITYEDGSKIRRSVTEKTLRKCQRALGALKRSIINGVEYIPPSVIANQRRRARMVGVTPTENTTHCYVDYLTDTWLKEKRIEGCTNNTLYSHEQRINSHITDFFRDMAIEDIKPKNRNSSIILKP